MINHEHKFIFIHIGKTGGSSIEQALNPSVKIDSSTPGIIGNTKLAGKHWTALEYFKKYPKEYKEYFTFSFVRNPWDRTVSHYEWQTFIGNFKKSSFKEWIMSPSFTLYSKVLYHSYLFNNNNLIVDFVGRFEKLQSDFNYVCDKIGIENIKLPHANKIDRKHYTEYYDAKTIKIVAEKCTQDIEYFNYKFGE